MKDDKREKPGAGTLTADREESSLPGFPADEYRRLIDALETGDPATTAARARELEQVIAEAILPVSENRGRK